MTWITCAFLCALLSTMQFANAQVPATSNGTPAESFSGEQFCFGATFTNTGNVGFGPYYRVILPPELTFDSATIFGESMSLINVGVFPAAPGNMLVDPLTEAMVTGNAGSTYYNVSLPLGAVVENGPNLASTLCMTIDANAAIGSPLTVSLQPNFLLGDSATGGNGAVEGSNVTANVSPSLFNYGVVEDTTEAELAPGSQFPATFSFTTDVANGKTIDSASFIETLASGLQYVGPTTVTGGTGCSVVSEPSTVTPGGTLQVDCTGITGTSSGSDFTVSFPAHVPDILDESVCTVAAQANSSTFNASFSSSALPQATGATSLSGKHIAIQQSNSASATIPGGTVTFTDGIQVSAFGTASSLTVTDNLADGYTFVAHSSMSVAGVNTAITPTVTPNGDGTTTIVYDVHAVTGNLAPGTQVSIVYTATIDEDFNSAPDPILAGDTLNATTSVAYSLTGGAAGCAEGSASSVTISATSATKTIINPQSVYLPGDTTTFRFSHTVPSGDTETITFQDYLPLPVFSVADINTTFGNQITLAPTDTAGLTPTSITTDSTTNSITITWPNLDVDASASRIIAVDLAAVVNDRPFSDRLSLLNILEVRNTNSAGSTNSHIVTAPIFVRAPVLVATLGVSASDNSTSNATISPASSTLPVNGDISSSDAGDTQTFVLTIENTGGEVATEIVATVAAVTGMGNASITSAVDGAGSPLTTSGTLETGLSISNLTANDGTEGAPYSTDTAIITFTRTLDASVAPRQALTTTASVVYTADNSGVNYPAVTETSTTTMSGPTITTTIDSISPGANSPNFVAGDTVTYRNVVNLPESQTDTLVLTFTLPGGMEYVNASTSVDTTGFSGTVDTAPTVVTSGTVASGQTVTITFDSPSTTTVTNNNNASDNTFAVLFNATVNDNVVNNASSSAQNKTLSSSLSYTGFTGAAVNDSASSNFTEHNLAVTTSVSPNTGIDAGDTVTVTIEVTNNGNAPAFDIAVTDTVNDGGNSLFDLTSIAEGTTPAGYTFNYSNPNLTISANNGTSLAAGATVTFTYTATVLNTVATGSSIGLNVQVAGDSQDGTVTNERADTAINSTTATINALTSDSIALISSSESWTSDTAPIEAAIGEVLTYAYTVTIAEGLTSETGANNILEVTLPAGYQFITGTGLIRGVFDTGISGSVSGALSTSNAAITPVVSGQVVGFNLGNVTNSDSDAGTEQIIVTFDVVVTNTSDNNRTDSKSIVGAIYYNNAASVAQTANSMESAAIAESNMTMTKTASPASVSGGATVTFTVVATNAAGTNVTRAWDWGFVDNLPARFQSPSVTSATLSRSSTDITGCASFSGNQLTVANTCVATATERYIGAGENITVVYTATVDSSIGFEETVTNTVDVQVTSLPGTQGTSSATPGLADADTGERTGSGNNNTSGQAVNDLVTMASASVTSSAPTLNLVSSGTSLPVGTDNISLTATVSIPTGTTNNFVYTLDLPSGLTYNGSAISLTNLGSLSTGNSPSTTPGAGTDPVVMDFGTVTNNTGSAVDLSIAVPVSIDNILANQNSTTLTSTASLSYQNIGSAITDTAVITVVEPNLTINQTITAGAAGSDGGDTISYQVTVANTSTAATAHRVDFRNVAPAELLAGSPVYGSIVVTNPGNAIVLNGTATPLASGDFSQTTTTNTNDTLTATSFDIPPSTTLTVTYNLVLTNTVTAGQMLVNQTSASYNSLAGGGGRDGSTSSSDDDNDASLNNYNESDSTTLTLASSLAVQTSLNSTHSGSNFAIGDTVIYDMRVDLVEGVTGSIVLTSVIPGGQSYVSSQVVAGGHISYTGAATAVEAPAGTITVDFGNVTNTADGNGTNDFFTLEVTTIVDDEVGNTNGTNLTTSTSITSSVGPAGPDTQAITIAEPNLVATITPDKASATLGDTVTLTVNVAHSSSSADAFETLLTLNIPTGLTYVTSSHSGAGSINESNAAAPVIDLATITQAEMNKSFTIQVTVDENVNINNPLAVSISSGSYTSQSGTPTVDRSYSFTASTNVTGSTSAFITADQTITLVTDNNSNGIADSGDVIQISAVLNNTGTTASNVVFTEGVPANTTYVGSSLTTSAGTANDSNTAALSAAIGTMNNGDTVTVSFQATVNNSLPAGIVIYAQGEVDSSDTVPEPTDSDGIDSNGDQPNQIRVGSLATALNEMYILQSFALTNDADANNTVTAGDTLTVYYDIQNTGSTTLNNVTLADTLPSGLTYVGASATATGGGNSASVTAGALSASIASITPLNSEQVSFQVTVDAFGTSTQTFTAQGTGNSDETSATLADSNGRPEDGMQSASITAVNGISGTPVLVSNLEYVLVGDVDSDADVDSGDTLLLNAIIQNTGNTTANNVGYSLTLPTNTSLVTGSGSASQGAVLTESPLSVNLGNLAAGETATVQVRVTVDGGVANGTVLSAQGAISADNATNVNTDDNGNSSDGVNPTLIRVVSSGTFNPTATLAYTNVTDSSRTAGNTFVQGNTIQMALTVALPEGPLNDASLSITLPTNFSYVNDSARLTRTFDTGLVSANNPASINAANSGTAVNVNSNISNSSNVVSLNIGDVINSDNDVNGETLIFLVQVNTSALVPTAATEAFTFNGGLTYRNGFNGSLSSTDTHDVTLENRAPTAAADAQNISEDSSNVSLTPKANDSDADTGQTIDITAISTTDNGGSVVLNGDDSVTYNPALNFSGTETFTYTLSDGITTSTGTVTLTITAVDDPPVAVDDTATTNEDTPLIGITVLSNDTDVDTANGSLSISGTPVATNGTVTVNGTTLNFTPTANFNGTATISYKVSDGNSESANTGTVTITVSAVEDNPVANNDTGSTNEETQSTNVNVLTNDVDPDTGDTTNADTLTVTQFGEATATGTTAGNQLTSTQGSTITIAANGAVTYDPATNFVGTETFNYTMTDGQATDTASVTFTVSNVNDNPSAEADTATVNEDSSNNSFNILTNDIAANVDSGETLTVTQIAASSVTANPNEALTTTAGGSVTVQADGSVSYTPLANFNGTDTFTYTVSDGNGGSNTGTVTITVTPVEDNPVANNDTGSVNEETQSTTVNVLTNDTDPDTGDTTNPDTLTVTEFGEATATGTTAGNQLTSNQGSTITIAANGGVTYNPAVNFVGTETFNYTMSDGQATDTATLTFTVSNVNDNPSAQADTATVTEDSSNNSFNILTNDIAANVDAGETLTVTQIAANSATANANQALTTTAGGTVTVQSDGSVSYTPLANFNGTDSFTYTVSDGNGGSNSGTVTITVTPVEDNPVANNDTGSVNEDTQSTSVNVLTNDVDPDTSDTTNPDTLTVTQFGEATATGTTAGNQLTSTQGGTITIAANGAVTYNPAANFVGTETFNYTMSDGQTTDTASLTFTVSNVNDNPAAQADTATVAEDSSNNSFNILTNDIAANVDSGETLTITQVAANSATANAGQALTTTAGGTVTVQSDGSVSYSPLANYNGTDSFTYTVSDGNGGTNTGTVTITVTPLEDNPVASNDTGSLSEDTQSTNVNVLTNDVDPDTGDGTNPDTLTVTAFGEATATGTTAGNQLTSNQGSTITIAANGAVTYDPAANFVGTETFNYTMTDGQATDTATLTFTVSNINDNPSAQADTATVNEDSSNNNFNILTNDIAANVDAGETLTVTQVAANSATANVGQPLTTTAGGSVTVQSDGSVSYTPPVNFNGTDSFTYTVSDGNGGTNTGTVTITVMPVEDNPVASNDSGSVNEDAQSTNVNVLSNDVDPDTSDTTNPDTLTVTQFGEATATGTAAGGTLTSSQGSSISIAANGTVTYSPAADFVGTETFNYTVSDGQATDTATLTFTVINVNDNPVAVADTATFAEDSSNNSFNIVTNDTDIDTGTTITVSQIAAGTNTAGVNQALTTTAGGTVTVQSNGTVAYTPTANFNGTDTFTYSISDGNGGTNSSSVTITVTPVNDAPVATNDTATVNEDSSNNTIAVIGNDSDIDGDTLTVNSPSATNGTVTVNNDNTLNYTPNGNFDSTDTITYTVTDGTLSDTATVTVTVTPINDAPVANADTATTQEDTPLSNINVLGNDTDIENHTLTVSGTPTAQNGTVTVNNDNTLNYTPNSNFNGTDTISYTISDGNNGTNSSTVTVTVTPVNDDPVAGNDVATTNEDEDIASINVLANDTDIDGDTLSVTAASATNGSVTINGDNTLSYTPNINFNGTGTITYTISDGNGGSHTGTVSVTVTAVNDAPVAINDTITTAEDTPLTSINVLANDTDTENDTLSISGSVSANNGTVTINTDNTLSYTPNADFNGTDTITYTVSDGNGGSNTSTVTVTVTPTNDAPVTATDTATTNEEQTISSINVLGNDSDIDGDTLTVSGATAANGSVTVNADNTLSYTPNTDFTGTDTITYTVSDGTNTTNSTSTGTVTVTVGNINDTPVAVNDTATVNEDESVTITPLNNDTDADNDTLTVTSATSDQGTVTINTDGSLVFTPTANFNGTATITYSINDGNGGIATAQVSVTVNPVADTPVAANDIASVGEDGNTTINVLANDTDADGDTLTVTQATSPNGTVTINNDGTLLFTPDANFNGTTSITYTVSDGNGGTTSATATVTVNSSNDVPVTSADAVTIDEDGSANNIAVLSNDTDADGDTLTVTSATASNGTVTVNNDGTLTYTPNANFNGTDTITYTISDGNGGVATGTVTVTVNAINDVPVATDDTASVGEDGTTTIMALSNDTDADGDTLTITQASSANGSVTINNDNTLLFAPTANFNGTTTITYTISDGNGGTATATVNVTVNSSNDIPVATQDSITITEDSGSNVIDVLNNDSDADGDTLTVTTANAQNGTVTVNNDGTLSYTPNTDFNGTDAITYAISDGNGGTATGTVTVTVSNVNDNPVITADTATVNEDGSVNVAVLTNDTDVDGDTLTITQASSDQGTVTVNADGTLSFTPSDNFNGTATVTYTVSDGNGGTAQGQLTVTVSGINDTPTAQNDTFTITEDSANNSLNVLNNDSDVDGDTLTITNATATNGTVTINTDGTLNYTPNANFSGTDTITYTVSDGNGGTTTATATISVSPVNDAPIANSDSVSGSEDTPISNINVLGNDSDPENDTLTVTAATTANGTVTVNNDGSLNYTPNANFNGTDTITYTLSDGTTTSTGTVTVSVAAVNDIPVAGNDSVSVTEDQSLTGINVLANDSDADGDNLQVVNATAQNGTVTVNGDGTLSYTPNANFNGTDTITYTVSDGNGGTTTATVTVTVGGTNDAPNAIDDTASTNEDSAVTLQPLLNDSDADGDNLTITSATSNNGTVTINNDGTVSYTPESNFNGTDTITYQISDGNGGTATGTITVTVSAVNDQPVAENDVANITEDSSNNVINVLSNDTDIDGDTLTVTQANAQNGTVTINTDGTLNYTPNANFTGTDTITYTVSDGNGGETTATVTVTVGNANDVPIANDDTFSATEDQAITLSPLGNDSDADGDTLTITTANSEQGTVTINADGTLLFTPNPDFNGTATITYDINDGNGGTATGTITVEVAPVDDPPVANDDIASVGTEGSTTIDVLSNDSNPDGDTLTITQASSPNGQVVINDDGTLTFTPDADFNGTTQITYTVTDSNGNTSSATITVTVNQTNTLPLALNDAATVQEDGTASNIDVLSNDNDVDGDTLTVTEVIAENGTVSINDDGTLNYTPNANFNGTDTITYTISDGNGGTTTGTVTVTVEAVNDQPVANNDTGSVGSDGTATINVLGNDSDVDGDTLTITEATSNEGTVTINDDGTLLFVPAADFTGTATITYAVSDGNGGTATATVSVSVNLNNQLPIANADSITVDEDVSGNIIDVLNNDSDPDGDTLSVTSATANNGTVTVNPDGTLSYTPNANFNGIDTITYEVSDGNGGTATATVTVTVSPVNDSPVAQNDTANIDSNSSNNIINVLGNDSDVDGDTLSVIQVTADNGTVTINADGTLSYTPNAGFSGTDTITYTVSDGNGGEVTATVSVTVNSTNSAPVANDDAFTTTEDQAATISPLDNDSDADGDTLTITSATSEQGTVTINADGTLTFVPAANFNGPATITYVVSDGNGGTATATISVTVTAVNDAPVALNDVATVTENSGNNTIDVLSNDTDAEGDALTVTQATAQNGTVTVNPDGTLNYTPNPNFFGTDTITYIVSDGNGGETTATVSVTVNAVNDAPVANDDSVNATEDQPVTISPLSNDTDADGDNLTITSATSAQGTVTINTDGTLIFTPNPNFSGTATITYVINDGNGGTATGTITINVAPVQDPPVATDDVASVGIEGFATINVLGNDSDPDGDPLTVTQASSPDGQVVINADGTITFTPNGGFSGTTQITYTVSDGNGNTSTAIVTVTVNNNNTIPVALNDVATVDEDNTGTTIDVLSNDNDADGDTLTVTEATAQNGTVTINTDGTLIYTPNPNFNGTDTIIYTISDGNGGTTTGVVTVTVLPVNDPPVANDDSGSVGSNGTATINVLSNDTDIDGDTLTITQATSNDGAVTINPDGTLVFTPNTGFTGTATITYTISDGNGGTATATVTVTVNLSNQLPIAVADSAEVQEDSVDNNINVLGNDSDPDGDTLTVISASAANGTVTINPDGTLSYTPTPNFNGIDTITYEISDGNGGTAIATVTITVLAVNDPPVALDDVAEVNENSNDNLINVLGNDSDPDGDNLTVTQANANNGTVVINSDGTLSYTPNADFTGTDTFTYTIIDGNGGEATATVTITVLPINEPPVAVNDAVTMDINDTVNILPLSNDSDPDGDNIVLVSATADSGQVTVNVDGSISFTPDLNFVGVVTITYEISDGNGGTATGTITVTVVDNNRPPVINPFNISTQVDVPVTIDIFSVASDPDIEPITISSATPDSGTVTVNGDGTIVFTPDAGFQGDVNIVVCVTDPRGLESCGTFVISVVASNLPPEVFDFNLTINEDETLPLNLTGIDPENQALTYTQLSDPNGALTGDYPRLTYVPPQNFNGNTSFTYQANDGELDSNIGTVNITVLPVDDGPIAIDDNVTIQFAQPVNVSPLTNDSHPDNDTITLVGATSPTGTIAFNGNDLTYTPIDGFVGEAFIDYSIADSNGDTATAVITITVLVDESSLFPVITVPDDIFIDANALFTKVDLGVASAVDRFGNPLPVSTVDGITFYEPGNNTAFWTATDADGRTSIASQSVRVRPLVSIEKDQDILEGHTVNVGVHLNGTSPVYPLEIPYTVTGTANEQDHNLRSGSIVFESGSDEIISFEVFSDLIFEGQETIIITLSDVLNIGNKFQHVITINEENVNPDVALFARQDNEDRVTVDVNGGQVTVLSTVTHPDPARQFSYSWQSLDADLTDLDSSDTTFTFDVNGLPLGVYRIKLDVTDTATPEFNDSETLFLDVESALPVLDPNADSDGDGIPDAVEGLKDSDGDGIADFNDPIPECNVVPQEADFVDGFLLEGDPGVCMRLGNFSIESGAGGSKVTEEDIENLPGIVPDPDAQNVGGIYDFIAYGIPEPGATHRLVTPLLNPIPKDAVYRKFFPDTGWGSFIVTDKDKVWSSPGEPGYCFPPGGDIWVEGLVEGYWCVQVEIVDGGPNDADGLVNGTVVDPGGVSVLLGNGNNNQQPVAIDDTATTKLNTPISINALTNDSDPDDDNLVITSADPNFGTAEIINNEVLFTPTDNYIGEVRIGYGISDNNGGTARAVITVNVEVSNQPPVAIDDAQQGIAGETIEIDAIINDSDPDGDNIEIISVEATDGVASLNPDGTVSFTPDINFSGVTILIYQIRDTNGGIDEAVVQVTVASAAVTTRIENTGGGSGGGSVYWLLYLLLAALVTRRLGTHYLITKATPKRNI